MNIDTSVVNGVASGGGLLRDHEGKLIFAFYKDFGQQEVLYAEALSLLHGLSLCQQKGLQFVMVEVDSSLVIHLIIGWRIIMRP